MNEHTLSVNSGNFDDVIRSGLKSGLDGMGLSAEAKRRMAQAVDEKVAQQQIREGVATRHAASAQKRRPAFRFAAIAAAIAATMGLGTAAYASGALVGVGDAVATLFGGGPAPTEIVDKIGHPIGAAQSQNGVTVSADAVIADGQNYAIVYSIRKDDGSAFEGVQANEYGYLNVMAEGQTTDVGQASDWLNRVLNGSEGQGTLGSYGCSYFYDADPSDNAIQMVEQVSTTGTDSILGRTAHATFGTFLAHRDSYEDATVLAEGNWNLAFTIDCENASRDVPARKAFVAPSGAAIMDRLSISPIAISTQYTLSADAARAFEDMDDPSRGAGLSNLQVLMADGSTLEVPNPGGIGCSPQPDGTTICNQNIFLPQIIDPDLVTAIVIGGTSFAVPS